MLESILCLTRREVFYAHNVGIKKCKLFSFFACGNCMVGRIRLNKSTGKLSKKECDICGCKFELSAI